MTGTNSNHPLQIGRIIKERIKEKKLAIADVCANTDVRKSTLYKIFDGTGGSIDDLCALITYLEMTWLIGSYQIQTKPKTSA